MNHSLPLAVYYGHHKCASTWIWQILADISRDAGWRHVPLVDPMTPFKYGPLTDHRTWIERRDLQRYVDRQGVHILSHLAARQEDVAYLRPHRGFHVIRDPRDIIVSAYFSHRFSHPVDNMPHMAEHRQRLNEVSLEEGLFLEMGYSAQELEDLREWDYHQAHILEVKMEDLISRPYQSFLRIFTFLGLLDDTLFSQMHVRLQRILQAATNRIARRHRVLEHFLHPMTRVPAEYVLGRVYDYRFDRLSGGRTRGKENPYSHYRKGIPGDWINYFTEEHVAYFKSQYNDLLLKTGYERHPDWNLRRNRYTREPSAPIFSMHILRSNN